MRQPQAAAPSNGPLAATLQELRDRTGLSLAALATRTPYSKSAWHRYLTGAKHPPRSAVEALARLAGADPAPALALWDAADDTPSAPAPEETGRAPSSRARARRLPLPALTLLTAVAAVAAALATPSGSGPPGTRGVMGSPRCHGRSCQGELPGAAACAKDAQTKSAVTDATYTVRLRYSPSCGTAWSQVRVRGAVVREISVRAGENELSATYSADDTRGDTSPMLAVSSLRGVEACAEVGGELACTGLDDDTAGQP
ncbi:DUF2690 domain-containing protein [Streptomyces sp. NPDC005202]|uniref:helix-turn-helix domain-containing protein n=1 Tax=Streptomyces sp. NPDC005202 TaxID=3157021 RepID=UPI0033B6B99B